MPVALITGASLGLGRALATELAHRGWSLVVDGRRAYLLDDLVHNLSDQQPDRVTALPGSVADPAHRDSLLDAVKRHGRLDLLVNNASLLGPSPQPHLRDYPLDQLAAVYGTDVLAPIALTQLHYPLLVASKGTIVNISSDAGVEAYEGWGGYGSAKAALDQASAVFAVEEPALSVYAFDPGDMRTDMQQQAFPGEDISDRPAPETVVPALLSLIESRPASGRYRARDLQPRPDPTSNDTDFSETNLSDAKPNDISRNQTNPTQDSR